MTCPISPTFVAIPAPNLSCKKIMSAEFYTINNSPVKAVAVRLAKHLLTLPDGSWAETVQAEAQLADLLPDGITVGEMLEFAARHTEHIHSSRRPWLEKLGRAYSMAQQGKMYPALAES